MSLIVILNLDCSPVNSGVGRLLLPKVGAKMKILLTFTALLLLVSESIYAQRSADMCRVTVSTWSVTDKRGTGIYELGKFSVKVNDDRVVKTFKFDNYDAGLIVTVGVEYGDFPAVEKGKPTEINLVIAVSDKEQDPFDFLEFPNNVAVGTSYGRRWGSLFVEKRVVTGQLIHAFTLACNDGSKSKRR
jgi:hypothetical protein